MLCLIGWACLSSSALGQDEAAQVAPAAFEPWPMNYLNTAGPKAEHIANLLWGLIILSIAVVAIISFLVLIGVLARGRRLHDGRFPAVERSGKGVRWIYIGTGLSTLALMVFTGWTIATMAAIERPPGEPALTIEVTAQQWWWELRYTGDTPSQQFETANEIHIPVGVPVRFRLTSPDVIHSFWIPTLGDKTDAIPGRTNETWLQADKPGVYRGQCVEYCGLQHAHMGLRLIADTPADFEKWRNGQLQPAPISTAPSAGQTQFVLRCGGCHTVRGTNAGGEVGPDLTHLMSRGTIAALTLENNIANLSGWIADPQEIKPGTKMPRVELSGPELSSIRDFLLTLH